MIEFVFILNAHTDIRLRDLVTGEHHIPESDISLELSIFWHLTPHSESSLTNALLASLSFFYGSVMTAETPK